MTSPEGFWVEAREDGEDDFTYHEATDFTDFAEEELASDEEIASEVDRYIIWPGQATAYMTGALEIERLRAEATDRLGSRFDPRSFHDAVLQDGSLPLPMLGAKLSAPTRPSGDPARR